MTLSQSLLELVRHPHEMLLRRWNWKVAAFSSLFRGTIFLVTNLSAGWDAARGAMIAEFVYRALTAGFYGAISQQFRRVTPAWRGTIGAVVLVPAFAHLIEFCIHSLRGTPNLKRSIMTSIAFSLLSVLFNLHIMRNGAMIVGREGRSFADDMRAMPRLILSFLLILPRTLIGLFSNKERVL
jgi:hypothetical protein